MKTSHIKPLFLFFLLCGFFYPQPVHADYITQTRYLNLDQFENSPFDYVGMGGALNPISCLLEYYSFNVGGTDYGYASQSGTALRYVQTGIRVYEIEWNDSGAFNPVEITEGEPVAIVQRNENGEGYQSAIWECPEYNFTFMPYRIFIEYWTRFSSLSGWFSWKNLLSNYGVGYLNFETESMTHPNLVNIEWNVTYYTKRDKPTSVVYSYLYYGSDGVITYESKVENIQFDNGVSISTGLSFSSGLIFAGVIGALVCVVAVVVGAGKKRR